MKKIFTTFLILFFAVEAFCQLNYTQDLEHIAQIKFPAAPKIEKIDFGVIAYQYKSEHEIYIANIISNEKTLTQLFAEDANREIYNEYISKYLAEIKGKLIYKKNISMTNLDGIEYQYSTNAFGWKSYSFNRLFFLNDTLVSFSIFLPDSLKKNDKKIDTYFSSFKITIPANHIASNNQTEKISGLAKLAAYIIFIAIPVLIGLGIVFLIKKIAYRKVNHNKAKVL